MTGQEQLTKLTPSITGPSHLDAGHLIKLIWVAGARHGWALPTLAYKLDRLTQSDYLDCHIYLRHGPSITPHSWPRASSCRRGVERPRFQQAGLAQPLLPSSVPQVRPLILNRTPVKRDNGAALSNRALQDGNLLSVLFRPGATSPCDWGALEKSSGRCVWLVGLRS